MKLNTENYAPTGKANTIMIRYKRAKFMKVNKLNPMNNYIEKN